MSLIPQFLSSLHRLKPFVDDGPWSMVTRAALSAADTFPGVVGAAVCLGVEEGMRIAVGVSDGEALLAEQLEFTVGDGPGLLARRTYWQVTAGGNLRHRWPVFHDALATATGYRAVRAVPLTGGVAEQPPGVLLLMYATPDAVNHVSDSERLDMAQLSLLIGHGLVMASADLVDTLKPDGDGDGRPALDIRRRLAVPTAVGMVLTGCHLTRTDAWAVLRGCAYARSQTIDDTAHDLVTGRLPVGVMS